MKRYFFVAAVAALLVGFWFSADAREIAAGVAIFLFGILMLEDGFRRLSGGSLERMLAGATRSMPRSLAFGIVSTSLLQSSSLVSVVAISFLSAGLIPLYGGIGIIFGANLGTTTGAWLVAGIGLKVDIAAYAMPMIAVGAILVFQKQPVPRGIGYALAGLGFLFLGIHHMKVGFEAFRDHIDIARYAMPGIAGLIVYTAIGAAATVIMQSSHATMVLVITALAASQITYDNAIALAIGANIGTTVTAILGSLGANYQGRRLALAHLVFNLSTAVLALAFVGQLRVFVDLVAAQLAIAADDYALKLAIFHTVFNLIGVIVMLPLARRLVTFLERRIPEPAPDVSRPRYLNQIVDDFPETLASALRKEVLHLNENATKLVLHGLNLHREDVFEATDIAATVRASRKPIDLDIADEYERRVKTLYSAIVDFATRARNRDLAPDVAARIDALRDMAGGLVRAVKSVKHIRKNVLRYATHEQGAVTDLYDGLRTDVARVMVVIRDLASQPEDARSALSLDAEVARIDAAARSRNTQVGELIGKGLLDASAATSFLNDATYADGAVREFLGAARAYYGEQDRATTEVEGLLALDEEELEEVVTTTAAQTPEAGKRTET